ncbi:MAG: permease [Anaerolineae bacterium]
MVAIGYIVRLLQSGLGNLGAYLAAHVLLCLLPAFFIAGAMAALIPKESVTRFLGPRAPKYVSFPAAALAGSVLAVCSCTIVPLFAGIYKKGAGLGPAITFLFFAPAANILALAYTGVLIGGDIALARIILSLAFGIGIGLIMALIFRRTDADRDRGPALGFEGGGRMTPRLWAFMLLLAALLIAGTLKVGVLTGHVAQVNLPIAGMDRFQDSLFRLVPFDPAKGEEGISAQGAILIGLLVLIGLSAWRGLGKVDEGFNRWTGVSLGLIALTLALAATRMEPLAAGLQVFITGRMIAVLLLLAALTLVTRRYFAAHEVQEWLWETWRFVRQIFPLLVVGVFAVGIIRQLIRPEWIFALAGRNTLLGNLAGVIFGVFLYFPTLVEVPIAKMFLGLGMHRGPLVAYLMADPELSLQSILMVSAIIGKARAWTYVALVAVFSTVSGLIYGAWVDGASLWLLALYLLASLALLAAGLYLVDRRNRRVLAPAEGE